MHIKSKFELNYVHIAVLAICSLLSLSLSLEILMMIMAISIISFLLAIVVSFVFFRNFSRKIRVFISAVITALVIVCYEFLAKSGELKNIGEAVYYSILPTLILCVDAFYVDYKVSDKNYFLKMIRIVAIYAFVFVIYAVLKEFLAFGKVNGVSLFNYKGYEFFNTITFDFIFLGLICAILSRIATTFTELYNERVLTYNKYKAKIRKEKSFIYDYYRRKKLITSKVIINKVGDSKKESNEDEENEEFSEKPQKPQRSVIKHKPRKNVKLRVSKEAKVEKLFDRKDVKEDK